MIIIDGQKIKSEKLKTLQSQIQKLDKKLSIATIQVGENNQSQIYIKQQQKLAQELNYNFILKKFPPNTKQSSIIKEINNLNNNDEIDGIIIHLPLPTNLDEQTIQNSIDPLKDIDGQTNTNISKLVKNQKTLIPCTPKAIIDILDYYHINPESQNITIIGRSISVGKPLAILLTNKNATVTLCHSKTRNLKEITSHADILITAVGKKHLIKQDMVKPNTIVIDIGINISNGKIYGDVDFENVKNKCTYITPVPGGVGPVTTYELFANTYEAHQLKTSTKTKK